MLSILSALSNTIISNNGIEQMDVDEAQNDTQNPIIPVARKVYEFYNRIALSNANRMSDLRFRRIYRMTRTTFQSILNDMGGYFSPGLSPNRKSITPVEKILVFISFLAGNTLYITEWVSL